MRQSFVGQEFWHEHDEEGTQEKDVGDESGITVAFSEAEAQQGDGLPDEEEKAGEEESANKGIEDGIGRIVVAPVLVTPEIVFEERKSKGLGYGAEWVTVVDVWVEDGDVGRAGLKVFRMSNEKIIEHGGGGEKSTADEDEGMFPEAFEEMFVGEE